MNSKSSICRGRPRGGWPQVHHVALLTALPGNNRRSASGDARLLPLVAADIRKAPVRYRRAGSAPFTSFTGYGESYIRLTLSTWRRLGDAAQHASPPLDLEGHLQ